MYEDAWQNNKRDTYLVDDGSSEARKRRETMIIKNLHGWVRLTEESGCTSYLY